MKGDDADDELDPLLHAERVGSYLPCRRHRTHRIYGGIKKE